MKTAIAHLKSISPYSQSRVLQSPRLDKESPEDHEKRCWRERLHCDASGAVFIPPMAFKNCLSEAARYLAMQISGKGKSTYTKHFEAGVLVTEPLGLGMLSDSVQGEWLFVPSDGKRGGSKRVMRCFPLIPAWSGNVSFYVLDETITEDVFRYHLEQAGKFIGIGRFRPRNNGFYGRFAVESMTWE